MATHPLLFFFGTLGMLGDKALLVGNDAWLRASDPTSARISQLPRDRRLDPHGQRIDPYRPYVL